jgi:hypothetical protein
MTTELPSSSRSVMTPCRPRDVRGVETDRGFVEDVEDSGGLVANRAGELDALAFAGRQGRTGPVEGEVTESEVEQPASHAEQGIDQRPGHGLHR